MEMLEHESPDITRENIDRLARLFPSVVTEVQGEDGTVHAAIDADALRDLVGDVAEGTRERYQFTWPGKRGAKLEARKPCDKTMRPCPEKSVNWDTTQNLYIEGDNLEALKIMRETYAGKVKLIYIDPPYNTGHDFIYDDDFAQTREEYDAESGDYDEEGGRLVANPESSGRFHSDWCSMMYPRLLLARDLLTNDGSIFISIDDNESANLRKICDEVFGASNFMADIVWKHTQQSKNDELHFSRQYNHIFVYAKEILNVPNYYFERTEKDNINYSNPDNDPKGPWRSGDVRSPNYRRTLCFPIMAPDGSMIEPPQNGWRWSEASIKKKLSTGEIKFKSDYSGIIRKIYLVDQPGRTPENLWQGERFGTTRNAAALIKGLFDGKQVFDTPKPIELIEAMLEIATDDNSSDIVLDFFSGSSTTAHAVLSRNARGRGNRKFIMVQLPEPCAQDSEANKAGYSTICDLGEERIRRAGYRIVQEVEEANRQLKIDEDPKPVPDIGFRVLKIGSSNFEDAYAEPDDLDQSTIYDYVDNLKPDRTAEDLLFQVLPKFRIPYSAKIQKIDVSGRTVFDVEGGQLMACFDEDVDVAVIEEIAKARPLYAVFRDASLSDDATAANLEELFKTYSPDTIRCVI